MLHSDLFPEFGCDGELIEDPNHCTPNVTFALRKVLDGNYVQTGIRMGDRRLSENEKVYGLANLNAKTNCNNPWMSKDKAADVGPYDPRWCRAGVDCFEISV